MVADAPHLDGQYAAFGKVIEGMEEAKRIVNVKRNYEDRPKEDQVMKKVTVETFGVDYLEPLEVQCRLTLGNKKGYSATLCPFSVF